MTTNFCTRSRCAISQEWMSVLHVSFDPLCVAFLWPCFSFFVVQKVHVAPRLLFFLKKPGVDTTSLLLLSTSSSFHDILKHRPHEQQTMPASQHLLQSGHCCFEDVSQSSKISVLFMSAINSFDFSLNLLISFLSA